MSNFKSLALSNKNNKVYSRLVAKGYKESGTTQNYYPTFSKTVMIRYTAIAVQNSWRIKSTDNKSTFLQGKK